MGLMKDLWYVYYVYTAYVMGLIIDTLYILYVCIEYLWIDQHLHTELDISWNNPQHDGMMSLKWWRVYGDTC